MLDSVCWIHRISGVNIPKVILDAFNSSLVNSPNVV